MIPPKPKAPVSPLLPQGPRPTGGFALVIALSLMAFILLLLLSLVTFTRVESATANTALVRLKAQQNALLGLQVAIGQLQRYAGPDQAVTAPASTVYPEKDALLYNTGSFYQSEAVTAQSSSFLDNGRTWLTPTERENFDSAVKAWWNTDRQPHWTGVFAGHLRRDSRIPEVRYEDDEDGTRFGEPRRMRNQVPNQPNFQLPVWLVSGNEQIPFDPATATSYPAGYLTPEDALPDPAAGNDTIYLVDESSAPINEGDDPAPDGLDGRVKVRKVGFEEPAGGGEAREHYAYWVGDESVKFNFAVEDPFRDETSITSVDYRNRLQTPLYGGWRGLEPFVEPLSQSEIDALLDDQETFLRLNELEETAFLNDKLQGSAPDYEDAAPRQLFHHATVHSRSLLTDPVLGGLKKDLTRYLESGSGLNDSVSILDRARYEPGDPRFSVYAPGANQGFPQTDNNLPVWGDLREWFDNDAGESPSAEIEPSADFAPIITGMPFHAGFTFDSTAGEIRFHWMPVITLWNPYDTALNSASYQIEVKQHFLMKNMLVVTEASLSGAGGVPYFSADTGLGANPTQPPNAYAHELNSVNGWLSAPKNIADGGPLDGENLLYDFMPLGKPGDSTEISFTYEINSGFAPGESLIFSIDPLNPVGLNAPGTATAIPLQNIDFLATEPGHLSFPVLSFINPPPGGSDVGMIALPATDLPNQTPPTLSWPHDIVMQVNGQTTVEIPHFGNDADFTGDKMRFTSREFRHNQRYVGFGDNYDQSKYHIGNHFATFRKLYPTSGYVDPGTVIPDINQHNSPIYHHGTYELDPLIATQARRLAATEATNFYRLFAMFNPRARDYSTHPLEERRNRNTSNNSDNFGRMSLVSSIDSRAAQPSTAVAWDDTEFEEEDGRLRGFGLLSTVANKSDGTAAAIVGISELSIYNARRSQSNVLSIAQFNSANLAHFFTQPGFAVGNSESSPFVDRAGVAGLTGYQVGAQFQGGPSFSPQTWPNNSANRSVDLTYLLNENLWDRFFLSGVPSSGNFDPYDPSEFNNPRLRPIRQDGSVTADDLRDFETAAAQIGVAGGFNVNSTSVEAWRALLTSFRDLKLESQSNDTNPDRTAPISRTFSPVTDAVDFSFGPDFTFDSDHDASSYGAVGGTDELKYDKVLGGFRYMSEAMIEELAHRIVDEVRIRGPFFSVADFVNRRLVAPAGANDSTSPWSDARTQNLGFSGTTPDDNATIPANYDPLPGLTGLSGAMQRAINLSGINGGANYPGSQTEIENDRIFGLQWLNSETTAINKPDSVNDFGNNHIAYPGMRSYLDSEHLAGAPASEAGHLFAHTPGFITQSNLLNMMGSALTARGDTFRIRAYGDSANPATGAVDRAYLEAIIQRIPEPVDAADPNAASDDAERWIPTSKFGRSFRIVSLRWIPESEI